jgi:hypothetical protein
MRSGGAATRRGPRRSRRGGRPVGKRRGRTRWRNASRWTRCLPAARRSPQSRRVVGRTGDVKAIDCTQPAHAEIREVRSRYSLNLRRKIGCCFRAPNRSRTCSRASVQRCNCQRPAGRTGGNLNGYVLSGYLSPHQLVALRELVDNNEYESSKRWRGQYQELARALVNAIDQAMT